MDLNSILSLFDKVQGLPAAGLLCLASIALGYALKFWPWFPNKMIPTAVILLPVILYPIVADPKVQNLPGRIWFVRNLSIGIIIGGGSWMLHFLVVRRIEKLIIAKFGNGNGDTTTITKEETITK